MDTTAEKTQKQKLDELMHLYSLTDIIAYTKDSDQLVANAARSRLNFVLQPFKQ